MTGIMVFQLLSLVVFADQNSSDDAHDHQLHAADTEKQVEGNGCQGEQVAGRKPERALDHIDGGAGDDGHNGRPDTGHGVHHPDVFPENRVKIGDEGQNDHRRGDHGDDAGDAAEHAAHPVAVKHSHVSDHGARQAAADAGDVQELLAGDGLFLLHVQLLHLRYDAPAAAEGETAEFEELPKEDQGFFPVFHG